MICRTCGVGMPEPRLGGQCRLCDARDYKKRCREDRFAGCVLAAIVILSVLATLGWFCLKAATAIKYLLN